MTGDYETETYEERRLEALRAYNLDYRTRNPVLDRVVYQTKKSLGAQMASLSLADADQVYLKARYGIEQESVARDHSFCDLVIARGEPVHVENAATDIRCSGNPLVTAPPYVKAFASSPVRSAEGYVLGALCVIYTKPRLVSEQERRQLQLFADIASDLLHADHLKAETEELSRQLEIARADLRQRTR